MSRLVDQKPLKRVGQRQASETLSTMSVRSGLNIFSGGMTVNGKQVSSSKSSSSTSKREDLKVTIPGSTLTSIQTSTSMSTSIETSTTTTKKGLQITVPTSSTTTGEDGGPLSPRTNSSMSSPSIDGSKDQVGRPSTRHRSRRYIYLHSYLITLRISNIRNVT